MNDVVGFTSFEGQIPEVITSGVRTHCERCGGELDPKSMHVCGGNSFWHQEYLKAHSFVCPVPTCSVSIEHEHQPLVIAAELNPGNVIVAEDPVITSAEEAAAKEFFEPCEHDWRYHDGILATCIKCGAHEVEGVPEPLHLSDETAAVHVAEVLAGPVSVNRTHCEACGEPVYADRAHYCLGNCPPDPKLFEPIVADATQVTTERQKYEEMWRHEQYRAVAPGEVLASLFIAQRPCPAQREVIDFGAGTGRGALLLAVLGQCRVHMVDFAANSLDDDIHAMLETQKQALDFTVHDLNEPLPFTAEFGFCTDVMEHIPPAEVDRVLKNILAAAQHVFFQISCGDDVCGQLIHEKLHLSVHDYDWWKAKFKEYEAKIHWSENRGGSALFYLTAWSVGEDFKAAGVLNVEEDEIRKNVRNNCMGGWQQVQPHRANETELIILCGGPTLDTQLEKIKELRAEGAGTVTLNGAYHWAIEHGVYPGCQIVCDARPFNKRFVTPVIDGCKYLIASQCDPEVFAGMPPDRTFMWHTTADAIKDILQELLPQWWGVPGGCTVLLRAIPMLRMLGFQKFHVFGADSCLMRAGAPDQLIHHAYSQPENDGQLVIPVNVGGRSFQCHPWMIAQAQEWMELVKILGGVFEIEVYGDGLLAWIMEHAAAEDLKDELKAQGEAMAPPPAEMAP